MKLFYLALVLPLIAGKFVRGDVVCPGFSFEDNTYCDCEGDCEAKPEWCSCSEAKDCCKQSSSIVVCPGFSAEENTYCDCQGDCEEKPEWCSCPEAKECCETSKFRRLQFYLK